MRKQEGGRQDNVGRSQGKHRTGVSADVLIDTGKRTTLQYLMQLGRSAISELMIEE